jgi:Zn-dependent metalloprotease
LLQAQNIDTIRSQKNENGKISFAHVSNAKMTDAINFLKDALQTTSNDSFVLEKEDTDELGMVHQRYQQYYKGVKVENAEYMLHGKNSSIETMNGDFQIVNIASVVPFLTEKQALADALKYVNAKEYKWQDSASENFIKRSQNDPNATYYPKGQLVIERDYLKGGKNLLLSWKFSIFSLIPDNVQWIYVDANT